MCLAGRLAAPAPDGLKKGKHAMWSAFARQIAAYAITRRGKKLFAFIGAMLLCFATTLLIDMQLYLTAGFTGVLALFAVGAFAVQHLKLKRKWRERQQRSAEDAIRRAERAKARSEKIGTTKAALSGAVGNAAQAVSDAVAGAARFFADAVAEMAQEVSDAYGETKETVTGAVNGTAQAVSRGASSLMQAGLEALAKGFALFRRAADARTEPYALPERRLGAPHAIPRIGLRPDLN
jgi:hypothetical protein